MGLDMYAYSTATKPATEVDFNDPEDRVEIDYWRKHHDLHGWMERLYRAKGGIAGPFNCDNVQLTAEDLDELEQAIKNNALPETTGFFFGNNPPDNESDEYDLAFITRARQALQDGNYIYYSSWW